MGAKHKEVTTPKIELAMQKWDTLSRSGWQCSLVHKPFEDLEDDRWVFHGVRLVRGCDKLQRIASFSVHADSRISAIERGLDATDRLKVS